MFAAIGTAFASSCDWDTATCEGYHDGLVALVATIPMAVAGFLVQLNSTDALRDRYVMSVERELAGFGVVAVVDGRMVAQPSFHSARTPSWTSPLARLLDALFVGTIAAAEAAVIVVVWRVTPGWWWTIPAGATLIVTCAVLDRLVFSDKFTCRLLDRLPRELRVS